MSGTITGVLTITKNGNNNLPSEAAIAASYCGTLAVPAETGTVLSVDIKFAKTTLYVGYSRNKKGDPVGISDYGLVLSADGPIDATVIRSASPSGAAANGGLELSLTSQIETTIVVSPTILCNDGPVALDLSTQNPGGASLTGPLSAASAVTAQDGFTIPAVVEGQKSCQFGSIDFADPINETVALPATDTLTAQNITLSAKD